MPFEYLGMLAAGVTAVGFLAYRRAWFAAGCALLSQTPFWAGYAVWHISPEYPTSLNIVTDLAVSAIFVRLAYVMDQQWLIWLGVVFLCGLVIDLFAAVFGMYYYLELHEALHYIALVAILGCGYAVRVDRYVRRNLVNGGN